MDKSYEAVTTEQKIIYQSSFPKRVATSKKDTCVYREANYASLQVGIPGSCKYGYSVVNDPDQVNTASELLDKQVTKVQTCSRHARKVLGSQILSIDTVCTAVSWGQRVNYCYGVVNNCFIVVY